MSDQPETDFLPLLTSTSETTAWSAIGWLLFTILLLVSPALVWAVWVWAL